MPVARIAPITRASTPQNNRHRSAWKAHYNCMRNYRLNNMHPHIYTRYIVRTTFIFLGKTINASTWKPTRPGVWPGDKEEGGTGRTYARRVDNRCANDSYLSQSFCSSRYLSLKAKMLTASTWKPALAVGPGTGKREKGCHSDALMAGQFTWTYAPGLNWYPLRKWTRYLIEHTLPCIAQGGVGVLGLEHPLHTQEARCAESGV